jgi:hypothetical protein
MRVLFLALFVMLCKTVCVAQTDTAGLSTPITDTLIAVDQHYADSIVNHTRFVEDSLALGYIRMPDSLRSNQLVDSLLHSYAPHGLVFNTGNYKQSYFKEGTPRYNRNRWVLAIVLALIVFTSILTQTIGKDIYNVLQAFYSKRALTRINKEESLLNSWAFICLFTLFGFTIGLYVFQLISYYNIVLNISGLQLFLTLSALVIAFFIFKIFMLRVLGFVFDIRRLVREYVAILYLTYFNISFIFLPLVICFSLLPANFIPYVTSFSVFLVVVILLIQYLRSGINIISNFRLHKIYLFIYLCALEICPILILIKALNI